MVAGRLIPICALTASLSAQIQFPGSGGPFPGGGNPRGNPRGTGGPMPGGTNRGGGRGGRNTDDGPGRNSPGRNRKDTPPVITTTGILRIVAGNQFVLEADDHRIITYRISDKMTVLKDGKAAELTAFATADHLSVDANADDSGFFTAVSVTFNQAGTAREREEASRAWDLPRLAPVAKASGIVREPGDDRPVLRRKSEEPAPKNEEPAPAPAAAAGNGDTAGDNRTATTVRPNDAPADADDPGRPQLRRGRPAPRASARNDAAPSEPAAEPAPERTPAAPERTSAAPERTPAAPEIIAVQEDPVIVKAKEAAEAFSGSLPNFFCRQLTTRYQSERKDTWQALDTITADLAYENGVESYKNIKVGNKEHKGSMEDVGGSWSTGEFATLIDALLDPGTAATFRRSGQDTIQGHSATAFKFDVTRERSRWRVMVAGQLYYPAYRGTVWIDRETSRVLRLETESRGVPLLFPLNKVEQAVDYDFVKLATPRPFLLPVNAEVLSCEQASSRCSRNRIEFRNYRKFGAESDITFDEKQ